MTTDILPAPPPAGEAVGLVDAPKTPPVKVWAAIGVACTAFGAFAIVSWLASGDPAAVADGPTPIPDWMLAVVRTLEIGGALVALGLIGWFVARPWWLERRLSADGLLLLAIGLTYWQDPLLNYVQTWTTINTHFTSFGNWTEHTPGFLSPTAGLFAEAPLWSGAAYVYALFVGVLLATAVMRRAQRRWPRISKAQLVLVCYATIVVCDFILEVGWMRLGAFTYAGSIEELTLFHGHYYQFPVYEPILYGALWTGFACLRFFRDDKGRTFAERGVDDVKTSPGRKTLLRLAALVGATNVLFLALYTVPIQVFAMHSDPWPRDITKRSYLMDGICGPGTSYDCGGPGVPIPRRDSRHVAPGGRLVDGN